MGFCPDFRQIKTFGGAVATPASLLHQCSYLLYRQTKFSWSLASLELSTLGILYSSRTSSLVDCYFSTRHPSYLMFFKLWTAMSLRWVCFTPLFRCVAIFVNCHVVALSALFSPDLTRWMIFLKLCTAFGSVWVLCFALVSKLTWSADNLCSIQ